MLAVGLMSGTSADGVDAALVRTDGEAEVDFLDTLSLPYSDSLRSDLIKAAQTDIALSDVLRLENTITRVHIEACDKLLNQAGCDPEEVSVIGFHGHTVRHEPARGITWQLGNAALLASQVRARVVHDFRRADIALGGQGAPLAPLFHRAVTESIDKPAIILNLGGVANITWLGANGAIRAGDTGPGCGLLDLWASEQVGVPFDRDGVLAQAGKADTALVRRALEHNYFQQPFPKSADRFEFGFVDLSSLSPPDGAATLCALTAEAVACASEQLPERAVHCWVTGGGAKHSVLMQMLRDRLGHAEPIETIGLNGEFLEAQCFAWLSVRRLRGLATSLPETTGTQSPTCGGAITEAPLASK